MLGMSSKFDSGTSYSRRVRTLVICNISLSSDFNFVAGLFLAS